MSEAFLILWTINFSITVSALISLTLFTYMKGYWHWPWGKLAFLSDYRYNFHESEGNRRYIEIFVGNTYIHATMKLEMTPDGLFDYCGMVIDGIGTSYKVAPPRGTNILEVHKAIKNLLEETSKKHNMSIKIEGGCQMSIQELIDRIDNLKYTERIANEQK